jgi:hypothetical protein
MDDYLAREADRILGLTNQRARKRKRKRKPRSTPTPSQSSPNINITVNVADTRKRPGSVRPGRPGDSDVVANGRSRIRRIGPSPG